MLRVGAQIGLGVAKSCKIWRPAGGTNGTPGHPWWCPLASPSLISQTLNLFGHRHVQTIHVQNLFGHLNPFDDTLRWIDNSIAVHKKSSAPVRRWLRLLLLSLMKFLVLNQLAPPLSSNQIIDLPGYTPLTGVGVCWSQFTIVNPC